MQTERVTFLTSRSHKKALDAYAKNAGRSVGHVVREATARYIAQEQNRDELEKEAELTALVREVNKAVPKMKASLESMSRTLRETSNEVDRTLRAAGIRK